jgi:hypothetical protein
MTVTLPDTMRDELNLKAKSAGFQTVDTYVAYLVVADDGDGVDEFADAAYSLGDDDLASTVSDTPRRPALARR